MPITPNRTRYSTEDLSALMTLVRSICRDSSSIIRHGGDSRVEQGDLEAAYWSVPPDVMNQERVHFVRGRGSHRKVRGPWFTPDPRQSSTERLLLVTPEKANSVLSPEELLAGAAEHILHREAVTQVAVFLAYKGGYRALTRHHGLPPRRSSSFSPFDLRAAMEKDPRLATARVRVGKRIADPKKKITPEQSLQRLQRTFLQGRAAQELKWTALSMRAAAVEYRALYEKNEAQRQRVLAKGGAAEPRTTLVELLTEMLADAIKKEEA